MTPKAADDDAYGKKVSDLQNGIKVEGYAISGNLNYVTGYTGFNSTDTTEQSGNYLALQFAADPWPDEVSVQLVGGKHGPVKLSMTDNFCVFLVTDPKTQKIRVFSDKGGSTVTRDYDLKGLVLATVAKTDAGVVDRDVTG